VAGFIPGWFTCRRQYR